ncbi:MAG: peptidase [Synechococcales cyanobacterium RM1_1_8]|nr:peptidase [Synechococcales cyanobacterium RM1_1_8]
MLKAILGFELRYHLRRMTFWLLAMLFFSLGFVDVVSKASEGKAFFYVNSPSEIFQTVVWYSIFAILATSAFTAETFVRDSTNRTESLILSTPISRFNYLGLRFLAAFVVTVLAFSTYLPGMVLGQFMPNLNPYALGPLRWEAYGLSYAVIALPNLLLSGALSFAIAARSRSLIATYVGAIALVMLYLASLMLLGADVVNFEQYRLWAMLDPFGFYALEEQSLAWTVEQFNTLMPQLSSTLLWNRLLWMALSLGILGWSYGSYKMRLQETASSSERSVFWALRSGSHHSAGSNSVLPPVSSLLEIKNKVSPALEQAQPSVPGLWVQQLWSRSLFELRLILQGRAFLLLTGFGLLSLIIAALGSNSFAYSNPSTDILVHSANLYLDYVLFIIIIVYAAELIWRDRSLRIQSILDAMPISSGVLFGSKLLALFAVITLNLGLAIATLTLYQIAKGYYQFDFPLYFKMLFGEHGPYFYLMAVLALFAQVVTRHKYAGMALTLAIALSKIPLDALGWYHNLYRFGEMNAIEYSPMNGYGHLWLGHRWYVLYWGLAAAILALLSYLFWQRGTEQRPWLMSLRQDWNSSRPNLLRSLGSLLMAMAGVGGWILYNTTWLNAYQPPGKEETAAEIERRYRQYEPLPMPTVTATQAQIELYPDERYLTVEGSYTLENRTDQPIQEIHLITFINLQLGEVQFPGATLKQADSDWGYYIYDLAQPMQPGEVQTLQFKTFTERPQGFTNQVDSDDVYMVYPNEVVGNGSNLHSPFILPFVGYTKMVEHKKAWMREAYNLPPLEERMRPHSDPVGLSQALTLSHLGWGDLDLTIGTTPSQTAVTNGELVQQWTAKDQRKNQQGRDRQYFRYRSPAPNRGKFTIYSADYAIHRNNNYSVPIELYHHPQHSENVKLIAEQAGQALEFYEARFGPFPFETLRFVEFVYYDGMVFSDGGTIGLPESLIWKADAQGPGKENLIDWVSYLLAYAWWEDQLIAADVAGGMTIREALSDYSSRLYQRSRRTPTEHRLARQQTMRTFFRTVGKLDFEEPALDEVYNELPIARHKGGMTLELIEDLIGPAQLEAAINNFLEQYRYQPAPYATLLDLRSAILSQTPAELKQPVSALFEQVTTYQVGIISAKSGLQSNGRYQASLTIEAQQLLTQGLGQQQADSLKIPVTVTVNAQDGSELYRAQHQLSKPITQLSLELDQPPTSVAVDPDYLLPSVYLQDNRVILPANPR